MSKMTLLLKELDCPHCAEKIEKRVGELSSVKSSNLDFINKKLTVDFDGDKNALFTEIENVVHKLEPDVSVKELGDCAEKTLYLKLEDLDCPNCGEKKRPHNVCPSCGQYDKREVVAKKAAE